LAKIDKRMTTLKSDVNSRLKQNDATIQTAMARLESAEKTVESMKEQVQANKQQAEANKSRLTMQSEQIAKQQEALKNIQEDADNIKKDFRNVRLLMEQGQEMFLKNMENARDIYKRQYLALDEIINQIRKEAAEEETTTPAPATPPKAPEGAANE